LLPRLGNAEKCYITLTHADTSKHTVGGNKIALEMTDISIIN